MKPRVHIVSYTHWDREFRWEFEHTRMKFVECMDHLLEIMTKPDYKSFLLDGQVGLLDDYLEIRPEKEAEIRQHIANGRLEIGPWYSLPDCATLNGESVVRNLQHGVNVSKKYGSVLKCGYNVFSFGQIAQLPQIYKHFGIDIIIFYKSMHAKRSKLPEFMWEAPDGTQAYASRLGSEARWNFFFAGHIPIVYDRDPWNKAWRYEYGTLGKVMHTADPQGYAFFHEILDPETSYFKKNLEMGFKRSLDTVKNTAVPEALLFFDGTDFTEPHPLMPEIIKDLQEQFGNDYDIVHSTMKAYLAELKTGMQNRRKEFETVTGPMRDGPVGAVQSDVLTTHPELKILNSATENKLVRYAEPLSTMAWARGIDRYPATYVAKAWKLLFLSHAHDSIHGLGPWELAEGGKAHIRRANLLAQGMERKALGNLTKEINTKSIQDATTFLAVHNTAAFPRSEVVEAYLDIPAEVTLCDVMLEDESGAKCEIQELGRETTRGGIYHPRSRNMPYYCTRVHVMFKADNVPALGHKTYKIKWTAKNEYPYPHEEWDAPRVIRFDLLTGPRSAQNEHISLSIQADGSFVVTDLASGQVYSNLNHLLESGDIGNMWMSTSPDCDAVISSLGSNAEISCIFHGVLAAVFRVRGSMKTPACYDFAANRRSEHTAEMTFVTDITLKKGSRYVEVSTTIENRAKDHYLKVCFPTGGSSGKTCADGSFSVTQYPTKPDLTSELARHPAQLWFDWYNGERGLAVLLRSVKDYEILSGSGDTMAMGLLRGVGLRIPCDNRLWMAYPGDESSQALGTYTHEYAVMPHRKAWNEDGLYQDALRFNQPLKSCQFGCQDGRMGMSSSFVACKNPNLVLSAVKKADDRDSVLMRFFNPTSDSIETTLEAGVKFAGAYRSGLSEERGAQLRTSGRNIQLSVGKGEIVTIEFAMK